MALRRPQVAPNGLKWPQMALKWHQMAPNGTEMSFIYNLRAICTGSCLTGTYATLGRGRGRVNVSVTVTGWLCSSPDAVLALLLRYSRIEEGMGAPAHLASATTKQNAGQMEMYRKTSLAFLSSDVHVSAAASVALTWSLSSVVVVLVGATVVLPPALPALPLLPPLPDPAFRCRSSCKSVCVFSHTSAHISSARANAKTRTSIRIRRGNLFVCTVKILIETGYLHPAPGPGSPSRRRSPAPSLAVPVPARGGAVLRPPHTGKVVHFPALYP